MNDSVSRFLASFQRLAAKVAAKWLRPRRLFGAYLSLSLVACGAPQQPTIEVTLCSSALLNGSCPERFTQRKLQIPSRYIADLPPEAKKANKLVGDFRLNLRNVEDLKLVAPTLARQKEIYRASYEDVWVRPGGEAFEVFIQRTDVPTPFYNHEYQNEAARLAAQQWFEYGGFLVKRRRPQPQGPNRHEDLSPVVLKFGDGTRISAFCAKDLTLGAPVGCVTHDFRSPTLRLDYSSVVTTPALLKEVSDDIHKLIDKFTVYRRD